MKVARTLSLEATVLEDAPDPVAGPGEVVCRVLACSTCGSDVQDWYVARKLPAVLGHEPVGEVVDVGAGVRRVAAGDRVVIHHHAPCGACRLCARGHETLCERFRSTRLDPGGFAEYVRIEAALVGELLPLEGLAEDVATCVEPLGCALRAQRRAGLRGDDALLVVGAGASGLLHLAAARAAGLERLFVAEPRADRRAVAAAFGAVPHDGERVDVAVACTPRPEAIAAAAAALGPGGALCVYAPPAPGTALTLDGGALFLGELEVHASWSAGPADMRAAHALLREGRVDVRPLLTHRFGLADTGAALRAQQSGEALKAVVVP